MNLDGLVHRSLPPALWAEGDKIPWADPEFSRRMLAEHLSPDHDSASRRPAVVDRHIDWIHESILGLSGAKVLDLGCGPGLYTCGLARRGHDCTGIDIGPASIAHARTTASNEGLSCRHIEGDIRTTDYEPGFDLVMLIFGELHAFRPRDAARILAKAWAALVPGGRLLLEPHPHDWLRDRGGRPPSWTTSGSDLFSEEPHLLLLESFWDDAGGVATRRFVVVDAATSALDVHIEHLQAYDDTALDTMVCDAGFEGTTRHPSLTGKSNDDDDGLYALVAERPR